MRGPSLVVAVASDPDQRAALADAAARDQATEFLALEPVLGETLAAAPALAWTVAFDWLAARPEGRARVVSLDPDGEAGVVELVKEAA